ncbi:MAG: acyl--CoA ligase [Fimbriimonadaceae bacterium]|nr:acyl--CoA ligase [Alphaproteobacteria bacterium]
MPYGVTEQILEAYAGIILDLSLNKQVRRGDPIRHLDVETWHKERAATGLSDAEIANRIGLAAPQVTYIRNVVERRLFRTNQYRKLYRLGGGKRYRPGAFVDPEQALAVGPDVERLRSALDFDPALVARYITDRSWSSDTLIDLLVRHAQQQPNGLAIRDNSGTLSWQELSSRVNDISDRLGEQNAGRGEAVSIDLADRFHAIPLTLGALKNGNVVLPLHRQIDKNTLSEAEQFARVAARLSASADEPVSFFRSPEKQKQSHVRQPDYVTEILRAEANRCDERTSHAQGMDAYSVVGGDLAFLLNANGEETRLVSHTHHTLLAGARAIADMLDEEKTAILHSQGFGEPCGFAVLLALWLRRGVLLMLDAEADVTEHTAITATTQKSDSGSDMQTVVMTFNPSEDKRPATEVLLSSETLGCASRRGPNEPGAYWTLLPGVEFRERENNRTTYDLRGPGFAPGYLGGDMEESRIFQSHGWVRTHLNAPPRKGD